MSEGRGSTPRPTPEEIRAARFGALPPSVSREDWVETEPVEPPQDPEGGRDADNSWLIRYAAG